MIRILLADDQETVRRALRLLLEQEAGYRVVDEVAEAASLVTAVDSASPDLVLLDWELPGFEAQAFLPLANGQGLPIRIIAMSSRPEAQAAALAAGADGCISKGKPAEEVLAAIVEVMGGAP